MAQAYYTCQDSSDRGRQRPTQVRQRSDMRQLSTDRVLTESRQSPDRAPTELDRARHATDRQPGLKYTCRAECAAYSDSLSCILLRVHVVTDTAGCENCCRSRRAHTYSAHVPVLVDELLKTHTLSLGTVRHLYCSCVTGDAHTRRSLPPLDSVGSM